MTDLDVELVIEPVERKGRPRWKIEVRSLEPMQRAEVDPLSDADLAAVQGLPDNLKTWDKFLATLSPNSTYQPNSFVMRSVGQIIRDRILGSSTIAKHFHDIEARAKQDERSLRILLEVFEEDDQILSRLPLELAFDGDRYFFKRPLTPTIRCAPQSDAANLEIVRGARLLIATAHSDEKRGPTREMLQEHAAALATFAHQAGFEPEHIADVTPNSLRDRLIHGARADILYIACHGLEDPASMGRLILRQASLSGEELGKWLEVVAELGRGVQFALLCACSSAAPQARQGTSGMAQWIAGRCRARAALGFRSPVRVSWALGFTERLFTHLAAGESVDRAFAAARHFEPDDEPQWPLPLLYGRRRDVGAINAHSSPELGRPRHSLPPELPTLRAMLPRPPRIYFTGREVELHELRRWAQTPGLPRIAELSGEGGIGKTELARVIAHEEKIHGRPIIWLERADRDVAGSLATLISLRNPNFTAAEGTTEEDLAATMRRLLSPYNGLLVLDDIFDRTAVDRLVPGDGWRILATTRTKGLVSEALSIGVEPLSLEEAMALLARVAWERDEAPGDERDAAENLVKRLGRLPLALELAGGALRNLISAAEYLSSIEEGTGPAVGDRERVNQVLLRSLAELDAGDQLAFLALGILPAAGATASMVAVTLNEPVAPAQRRLGRLVRHSLASWRSDTGRYELHPLLRNAARERAKQNRKKWEELHVRAAMSLDSVMEWVSAPIGKETDRSHERWALVSDLLDPTELRIWCESGIPGGELVAQILTFSDQYRMDLPFGAREELLGVCVVRTQSEGGPSHGFALMKRAWIRWLRSRHATALEDCNKALLIFKRIGHRAGQMETLSRRASIRLSQGDVYGAIADSNAALKEPRGGDAMVEATALFGRAQARQHLASRGELDIQLSLDDYNEALAKFDSMGDSHGQANVLIVRSELYAQLEMWAAAVADIENAQKLVGKVPDELQQATLSYGRAKSLILAGDIDGAVQNFNLALEQHRALGNIHGQAIVLHARGVLEQEQHQWALARASLQQAVGLYRQADFKSPLADTLAELAKVCISLNDWDAAQDAAAEALAIATKLGNRYAEQLALEVIATYSKQKK